MCRLLEPGMLQRLFRGYPAAGVVDKYLLQQVQEERQEFVARRYYFLYHVSSLQFGRTERPSTNIESFHSLDESTGGTSRLGSRVVELQPLEVPAAGAISLSCQRALPIGSVCYVLGSWIPAIPEHPVDLGYQMCVNPLVDYGLHHCQMLKIIVRLE